MPVQLDFSKAQPIQGAVKLDFSKAQPIGQKGFVSSFADSSGISALAHPIDTILGLPAGIANMAKQSYADAKQGVADYQKEGLTEKTRRDFGRAVPIIGPALAQAQGQYDAGNGAGAAGTIAGTVVGLAAPEALKAIKPAAVVERSAPALRAAGESAQESAGAMVNRTAGMLKNDFKRGANGGRGYLAEGGGVATSMKDLARRAADAKEQVGQRIGDAYKKADASGKIIPAQDVANAISGPMKDAWDIATGPGAPEGLKSSLEHHASTFTETLQKGIDQGGFTPSQVWDLKQKLAKGTSWSDATQLGMKQVRQQQVGALAGVLQDNIPELAQANQSYMDLTKLAGRAEERASTGSQPLTAHAWDIGSMVAAGTVGEGVHGGLGAAAGLAAAKLARSVPGRTAAATGLYNLGSGLTSIADRIEALRGNTPAATSAVVSNPVGQQVLSSAPQSNAAAVLARIQNLRRRQQ